jgi:nucleoside phosphorylase
MATEPVLDPSAWIAESTDFPRYLDLAYRSHFGEIWLFNNDLRMLLSDEPFRRLYLDRIADTLRENIDAIKILVNHEAEKHVFPGLSDDLQANLRKILKLKGGKRRLATMYFGKVKDVALPKELQKITKDDLHTWIFYTHRNSLEPNAGFVMVRHNMCPFHVPGGKQRFAFVWQMQQERRLQENLQQTFERIFQNPQNFSHLALSSRDNGFRLVRGWSPQTKEQLGTRKVQSNDAVAFGDRVHVAVLASQMEELEPLMKLLGDVEPSPAGGHDYCATMQHGTEPFRILLSVIGEGNIAAAARTWAIIDKWQPDSVLLTGVAGGDPDDTTQKLGDIIIAKHVVGYEHGKMEKGEFRQRITTWPIGHEINQACAHVAATFRRRDIPAKLPLYGATRQGARVPSSDSKSARVGIHTCNIGSGSKLVADDKYFTEIREDASEAIHAVEMEGDGVCFACFQHPGHKPAVGVVKSIMDLSTAESRDANKGKREEWKKYASAASAAFIFRVLKELCSRAN